MIVAEWQIPAKTFLLGEYAVLGGGEALIITTKPCFKILLHDAPGLYGIHSDSPAGLFWHSHGPLNYGLEFIDPYAGRGGFGASTAQFLGVYLATEYLNRLPLDGEGLGEMVLLQSYQTYAWQGKGIKPSGADLLAQTASKCVFVDVSTAKTNSFSWPFKDLGFLIVRTGNKLRTDQHLNTLQLKDLSPLNSLVTLAKNAFHAKDELGFIRSICDYHQALLHHNWVASETLALMKKINDAIPVRAMKGSGAMGADLILIVDGVSELIQIKSKLQNMGLNIAANLDNLFAII